MKRTWIQSLSFFAFCILYAMAAVAISYQVSLSPGNDISTHANNVLNIWTDDGTLTSINKVTYFGWHFVVRILMLSGFDITCAACLACGFFAFLSAAAMLYVAYKILETNKIAPVLIVSAIALFVTAIFIPAFNSRPYYGQGSPTIWHSPTYNAVKPFALLACYEFFEMVKADKADFKRLTLFSLFSLFSIVMKPSFVQIEAPGLFFYLIYYLIRTRDWRFVLRIIASALPTIIVLLIAAKILLFTESSGGGGIIFAPFLVWGAESPNIPISALLLLAFPIFILILCRKRIFSPKSPYLFLVFLLAAGIIEATLIAEGGPRLYHGNFFWALYLSVFLIWAFMLPAFAKGVVNGRFKTWQIVIGGILVLSHFVSGIVYYFELFTKVNGYWY